MVHHTAPEAPRPLAPPRRDTSVQDTRSFGRWHWLLQNSRRLAIETDFTRKGPARKWRQPLLVEQQAYQEDYELWKCLLQYLHRTEGDQGVKRLFTDFWGRKLLFRSTSPPDRIFWQTIAEAALRLSDDRFLTSIYLHAEWMHVTHNTQWPDLYVTIVPHFLRTQQHGQAMKWHLQLAPSYYPGPGQFTAMMKQFCTDSVLMASFTLQSLYITSPERRMYDSIVPHLYSRGQSKLAVKWRNVCIASGDAPQLHAPSRQFLRWLQGYWRYRWIHPSEADILAGDDSLPTKHSPRDEAEQQLEISREYMNYLHGKTFGLTAKTYNDTLGARWFASTWVGLDTAISAVAALGIQQIGPLSFQSICLREKTSGHVLARMAQLQDMGISLPESSGYVECIRRIAKTGDDELLAGLLESDLHPDVFDDLQLQLDLMNSSAAAGDWTRYTLLLAARLAAAEKSAQVAANTLLRAALTRGDRDTALRVLDDIRATKSVLDSETCAMIFKSVGSLDWHAKRSTQEEIMFGLSLCRRLSTMDIPIPARCWRVILYALGRSGHLHKIGETSRELLHFYSTRQSSRPGFVPVHRHDLPASLAKPLAAVPNLIGLFIPLDTPVHSPMHPLNQIFIPQWQRDLVRWSFRTMASREPYGPTIDVQQHQAGRVATVIQALSLLRQLRERGVLINLDQIRKAVEIRLAELYGRTPATKAAHISSRVGNTYSLDEMKKMIDTAWGVELLPSVEELKLRIDYLDDRRLDRFEETIERTKYFLAKYPA